MQDTSEPQRIVNHFRRAIPVLRTPNCTNDVATWQLTNDDYKRKRWKIIMPIYHCGAISTKRIETENKTLCLIIAMRYIIYSGERSVLTLGSLWLSYCVRDTAWSWFILIFIYNILANRDFARLNLLLYCRQIIYDVYITCV